MPARVPRTGQGAARAAKAARRGAHTARRTRTVGSPAGKKTPIQRAAAPVTGSSSGARPKPPPIPAKAIPPRPSPPPVPIDAIPYHQRPMSADMKKWGTRAAIGGGAVGGISMMRRRDRGGPNQNLYR